VLPLPVLFRSPPPLLAFVNDPWPLLTVPSPEVVLVEVEEPAPLVLPSLIAPVDSPLFVVLELGAVLLPGVVDVLWANAEDDAARPNTNTLVANKRDISSPIMADSMTRPLLTKVGSGGRGTRPPG
jgi:hypothetical protein